MNLRYNRLALIGLGLHARRIYLPILSNMIKTGELEKLIIFDIPSQREEIAKQLELLELNPDCFIELPENDLSTFFKKHSQNHDLNAMLISSDPLVRMVYYDLALENSLAVLADKPVFTIKGLADDPKQARAFYTEAISLNNKFKEKNINFHVQVQRRMHQGYLLVHNLLDEVIQKMQIPITSIHIQHADGMWMLPREWQRDYHPFKYGYGKLLHSGYHFVDLLSWFSQLNDQIYQFDNVDIVSKKISSRDLQAQWEKCSIPGWNQDPIQHVSGEYDVHSLIDFKSKGRTMTTANLQLQHNSFSDRNPDVHPIDLYKGIGRIRHERVDIKVSTIFNIQVHSYQSESKGESEGIQVGETEHFDIYVFRNTHFLPGKPFEKITLEKNDSGFFKSHNERAREKLLLSFLKGENSHTTLQAQLPTISMISKHYEKFC